MSKWTARISVAQKQAVVRAVVVDGCSNQEAARRARDGRLEGVPRFEISGNYVGRLVARMTANHRPEQLAQPGEARRAVDRAQSRILALILHEVDVLEKDAKAGRLNEPRAARLIRALAEWERSAKPSANAQPEQEDNNPTQAQQTAAAIVAELTKAVKQGNGNERSRAASLPGRDSERPPVAG